MYLKKQLDHCRRQNQCPANDKLCEEIVRFSQNLLLGTKQDTDEIADAFQKVYEHRDELT